MSGKLLILKPNGERQEIDYPGPGMIGLHELQRAVGARTIERVRVNIDNREYSAYGDEEGRRKSLAANVFATARLAPPFNPSFPGHQLMGNVAVWMPDTRNIHEVAKEVLLMIVNGLAEAGFGAVSVASAHRGGPIDWETLPVIAEADLIQQVFSKDQCFVYFRHADITGLSILLLMPDNDTEMIIDGTSPSKLFSVAVQRVRKDIFDEFED